MGITNDVYCYIFEYETSCNQDSTKYLEVCSYLEDWSIKQHKQNNSKQSILCCNKHIYKHKVNQNTHTHDETIIYYQGVVNDSPTRIGPWAKNFETPPEELVAGSDLKGGGFINNSLVMDKHFG